MRKGVIIFLILLVIISNVSAASYRVTQNGLGADYSVEEFNTLSGTGYAGDTFYFSGLITTTIEVGISGTQGSPVTIDGYEPDDTTYMNLSELTGRTKIDVDFSTNGILVGNNNYIEIQDFEITNCNNGITIIDSIDSGDNIVLKRNFIHWCEMKGIYIGTNSVNIIVGGSPGNGNVIKNVGQGTAGTDIVTNNPHDIIISYNHLYADHSEFGTDGITFHSTYDALIEYNTIHDHNEEDGAPLNQRGENGIDIKTDSYNIIIRYNKIYNHNFESQIILNGRDEPVSQSADQVYIYGNSFYGGNSPGVHSQGGISEYYDDIYIFSNIFHNMGHRAISIAGSGNYSIFNNVISKCSANGSNSYDAGFYIGGSPSIIKNNIYYKNRPFDSSYRQLSVSDGADINTVSDYNLYYWPGQTSIFRWGDAGSFMTLSDIKNGNTQGLPQESYSLEENPGLIDIDNNDFRVENQNSPVVDTGDILGTGNIAVINIQGVDYPVRWDIALHPSTDWSAFPSPSTIITANQNDHGTGWERGAYVYVETSAPICSEGQITQTCLCGVTEYSSGYCCIGTWQSNACQQYELCDNLELLMHFDEDSLTTIDSSGNNNDGIVNGATFTTGKYNGAFDFNGGNNDININYDGNKLYNNDITVAAWIYPRDLSSSQDVYKILDNEKATSSWDGFSFFLSGNLNYENCNPLDMCFFTAEASGNNNNGVAHQMSENNWYHVALTFTNNNNKLATWYVNGIEKGTQIQNHGIGDNTDDIITIGSYSTGGFFNGIIDELALWNRALTPTEITSLQSGVVTCSLCSSGADGNNNDIVEIGELLTYISNWKSGTVSIGQLLSAISEWKNGC